MQAAGKKWEAGHFADYIPGETLIIILLLSEIGAASTNVMNHKDLKSSAEKGQKHLLHLPHVWNRVSNKLVQLPRAALREAYIWNASFSKPELMNFLSYQLGIIF